MKIRIKTGVIKINLIIKNDKTLNRKKILNFDDILVRYRRYFYDKFSSYKRMIRRR